MYKHILLPVSFEDHRNTAAAVSIARKLKGDGGKVTMLHVMEQIPSYVVNYVPEGFHEKAKEAIVQSLADLAGDMENVEGVVVDGHSGRTILDWAASNQVDLIVIASHRPGMADYLLGSTAAQVVRHAKCAVHVVR
ncbi:Nucleotide-binding universal stress protein, UspA family [Shimia gijangensis]|uniref:Nucleotide-binding universal stress protein, UspA family n=1 Tax=Shimia gijangensis TaxID=1470563 RepID=A0A1M6ICZ5_9RHOB|nr:universal stress protein [Shimia gijangensis]SHJ32196.1 Nucleotide-binding universal stress protein, UspA family [Shimia gijangensis]